MILRKLCSVVLCGLFVANLTGQELNLNVSVTTPKLNLVDPQVFKTFENSVREFMNNTRWTDDEFESDERIEGNLLITIKDEINAQTFVADFRFNTIRPVYDSNYGTPILNFIEKDVEFQYVLLQPIDDSRSAFTNNLSSILTFYAYVIIGMDYDTFSSLGGDPYFQTCLDIVNNVPQEVGDSDWTSRGRKRGRYWIVENLLNPKVRNYRKAMYDYHRLSLDKMTEDASKARSILLSAITEIGNTERIYPNAMIVQMFTDSKREEIIEIFKEADRSSQNKVGKIMTRIDPARSSDYDIFK